MLLLSWHVGTSLPTESPLFRGGLAKRGMSNELSNFCQRLLVGYPAKPSLARHNESEGNELNAEPVLYVTKDKRKWKGDKILSVGGPETIVANTFSIVFPS